MTTNEENTMPSTSWEVRMERYISRCAFWELTIPIARILHYETLFTQIAGHPEAYVTKLSRWSDFSLTSSDNAALIARANEVFRKWDVQLTYSHLEWCMGDIVRFMAHLDVGRDASAFELWWDEVGDGLGGISR